MGRLLVVVGVHLANGPLVPSHAGHAETERLGKLLDLTPHNGRAARRLSTDKQTNVRGNFKVLV
jgi:hypothetical protein